jgi:hypothetical protein
LKRSEQMTRQVDDYLAIRRSFGYQLEIAGEQLHRFAAFADREAPGSPFTTVLALRWAQASSTGKQTTAACRLRTLRPFSRYLKTIEPRTEIVPLKLLGPAQYRRPPYIYSDDEICPPVLVRSFSRLEKEIPSTQQHKDMDESRLPGDLLDVLDDLLLRSVWLRSHGRATG